MLLAAAAALYGVNVAVGIAAQTRRMSFGRAHHVLYATVFGSAIAAAVFAFHPALLVTLVALALFPFASPRSKLHPTLALVGAAGYALALTLPW